MGTTISVLLALLAAIATYLGVYLTIHPPKQSRVKRAYKITFVVIGLISVVLIGIQTHMNEADMNNLPKQVAEYIKNTAPPEGYFSHSQLMGRPAPPTGLVAVVDGEWSIQARNFSHMITDYLISKGDPPRQKRGESDVDFVTRSNDWYADVMNEYKSNYADQVQALVNLLIQEKVLDDKVLPLAKNPSNPLGLKAIATQLQGAADKLQSEGRK